MAEINDWHDKIAPWVAYEIGACTHKTGHDSWQSFQLPRFQTAWVLKSRAKMALRACEIGRSPMLRCQAGACVKGC